ncbi:MAG: cobalamin-binding protein [Methanoregula sp.]|jgi:iron complex transport system substrate-binding protein|uniref:ABC transporter substrate-binding protein n=1 Tax=Methanoregula sp. TaxID=2052170 RepID=UPI002601428D|nr:cobalamin-binding protein [Methanoregula sp.]MCK9632651.1 cobalamin-binding protein [Methanoregula sp.]
MNPTSFNQTSATWIVPVLVLLLACLIQPVAAITVTDDAGTAVTLNKIPQRIVSLAPSNTELLVSLGLRDRMVGVTDVCDYPPAVQNITRIGGYSAISTEKVAATRPDLVVASDITPQETVSRLRGLGLTVVVVSPCNIDDMIRDIGVVGTLTGTMTRADELAANLSARLSAVAAAASKTDKPTVAHVVWHSPLYVSGNDTLQNDAIEHAGGVNRFSEKSGWGTVSLEEFLTANPDIIIVNGGGGMDSTSSDVILEAFMTNPQYASLSAVKNHRVYAVNADTISRAGPRIVDATEQVATIINSWHYERAATNPVALPATTSKTPGFAGQVALLGLGACIVLMRRYRL